MVTTLMGNLTMVTTLMGNCYVLGFAHALRFLQSQILCRLNKSPSDGTINQGPLCVYVFKKVYTICMSSLTSYSPCQSSVDYGNIKIIQHALTMSESSVLKLDTI